MPSQSQRAIFRRQVAAEACQIPEISADYNLPLHVGALFIILAVSFTACVLPIIVVKVPKLRIPPTTLFVVRHFGTGGLIATAFVHLLPTAFISLTDPCLPAFWHETSPAMGGALALAAVFGIIIIQMVFSPGKNCCAFPASMMEKGTANGRGVLCAAPDAEARKSGAILFEILPDTRQQFQEISMGEILVLDDNYSKSLPTAKLSKPLSEARASFPTNTEWSHLHPRLLFHRSKSTRKN